MALRILHIHMTKPSLNFAARIPPCDKVSEFNLNSYACDEFSSSVFLVRSAK